MIRPLSLLLAVLLALPLGLAPVAEAINPVGGILQNAVTANGNGQTLAVGGIFLIATYTVSGTFSATVNFEGQAGDSSFQSLGCVPVTGGVAVASTTATGAWRCNITGFVQIRGRVSGYASGAVTVGVQAADGGTTLYGPPVDRCGAAEFVGTVIATCPPYNASTSGDATAAIQAAWNATPQDGTLYIPCGNYTITSRMFPPVGIPGQRWGGRVTGCGSGHSGGAQGAGPGTVLTGNFSGAVLDFSDLAITSGNAGVIVENMRIVNAGTVGDTAGYAIRLKDCIGCTFRNLSLNAWRGLWFNEAPGIVISSTADNVGVICTTTTVGSGSVGIGFISHIVGSKVQGCEHGIRLNGTRNTVVESIDIEVNTIGLVIGLDATGANSILTGGDFSGLELEGNDTGIFVRSCTGCTFSSIINLASTTAPSGRSQYGFRLTGNCQQCTLENSSFGGTGASVASISLESTGSSMTIRRVSATNPLTGGKKWSVLAGLDQYTFEDTNFYTHLDDEPAATTAKRYSTFRRDARLQSLGQVSYITAQVDSKNLTQIAVPVTAGAGSVAVVFTITRTATNAKVVSATPSAGGSLVDGTTYYYCGAMASAHGEMTPAGGGGCGTLEKSCAPTGANLSCTLAFTALTPADGYKRRVYRGTVSGGPYDGYIEGALNSDANIIDAGTGGVGDSAGTLGLTALKDTSRVDSMDMVETDAGFAVIGCTTDWITAQSVTGIATTGYTVNFGTVAPGGGGLVTCMTVRG